MVEDEYEILPHQELEYLRREVERLKKNPFGDAETGQTLLDSMNNLTISINKLVGILTSANDEMVRDYHENKTSERLSKMMEQNDKLAQGIVAVGELVKHVMQIEKRNAAMAGGFAELSEFTTDIKKTHTNMHKAKKNPFDEHKIDTSAVHLDSSQLPRQNFSTLDPNAKPATGAHEGMPPSFAGQIPSAGQLPPISPSHPPPLGENAPSGPLPPIDDDEIPRPPGAGLPPPPK